MPSRPVFHLSIPVGNLGAAIAFYCDRLGGTPGRRHDKGCDIALFGAQLTLQDDPASVTDPMPRTRHIGATLDWPTWEALVARLGPADDFVEPPHRDHEGEAHEQAKALIADPSGNLIELKACRHPADVLGEIATD